MSALPPAFASLDPFVARWAHDTSAARAATRGESSSAERQEFYAAITPLLVPALELLDARPLGALDPAEQTLMNLCLAAAHVALAVEALGDDEPRHAGHRSAMIITRTPADA